MKTEILAILGVPSLLFLCLNNIIVSLVVCLFWAIVGLDAFLSAAEKGGAFK